MTNQYLEEKVFELEKRVEKIELSKIISDLPSIDEPCEDAISREAVLKLIENTPYDWSNLTERHEMLQNIRKMTSVTSSRRKGHWIPNEYFYGIYDYTCSECKKHSKERSDYCPKCGAEMENEE